jgi:serine/threonine-protein kinase
MSPEQVRGGPLDGRADLFSLAVLLYEALVGQSPFAAATDAQLLLAVRDARLAPAQALEEVAGPEFAEALLRALRPHPAERYTTAGEMASALAQVELEGLRDAEQPWNMARVVAETLAAEGSGSKASEGARAHSPFSAALLETRGDED